MNRWKPALGGCLVALIFASVASAATLEEFVQSIKDNDQIGEDAREDVFELIDDMRADEESDGDIVSESLLTLYPDFDDALAMLGDEEAEKALVELKKFAASDDKYLAAEATYYIGRAHMMQEHYEESLPAMNEVLEDHAETTFRTAEAMFFKGMSEVHLLDRKAAIKSLDKFILDYANAPERMQMAAWHNLEMMKAIEDGTLGDVQDRMEYSRRRLALAKSGERTQDEQENIIAMLDKLIEEAEQREQQGGS